MTTKKQTSKKFLSFLLAVVMLVGIAQIPMFANINAEATTEYKVGDIVEFGSYPQTKVTDARLITELNKLEKTWVSYGYYSGEGWYGDTTVSGDWMQYTDVEYSGIKYRGVTFTHYRPSSTCMIITDEWDEYSAQCVNGYYNNLTYWFKYEPLEWRILDPYSGLVLSETIIDSQPFQNKLYLFGEFFFNDASYNNWGSDYETSSIRAWLNNDFYNTAFSVEEKAEITETICKNDGAIEDPQFNGNDTTDKVFALSDDEFRKEDYKLKGIEGKATDYAKCQGVDVDNPDLEAHWHLRTADSSGWVQFVYMGASSYEYDNEVYYYVCSADNTRIGIRPAMVLDSVKHKHSYNSKVTTEPTCTKTGVKTFTCSCGDTYTEEIPVIAHSYNKTTITKTPTCVETGIKTFSCVCGDSYTETLPVVEHKVGNWTVTVEPTLETEGKKVKKCTVCKAVFEEDVIPKLDAKDFISVSVDNIAMNYKSTTVLNAKFGKLDGVDYTVKYESSNADIVSIDEEGNLTANDRGTATITCTITDEFGNTEKDTCTVEVTFAWWQWIIYILLLGFIWY